MKKRKKITEWDRLLDRVDRLEDAQNGEVRTELYQGQGEQRLTLPEFVNYLHDQIKLLAEQVSKCWTEIKTVDQQLCRRLQEQQQANTGPLWIRAFGEEYDVPEWISAIFTDMSYKDDDCPKFDIGKMKCDAEFWLWVQHPDTRRRPHIPQRFAVEHVAPGEPEFIWFGESEGELASYLAGEGFLPVP